MNQDELASLLEISIHALIDIERGAPLLTPELRRKAREVFREHDNAAGAAA
jgi:DNA-binding XRE family transcriptional regulator